MDYFFIGDPELLTAFRFVGISGTAVMNAEQAYNAFSRITKGIDVIAGVVVPHEEQSCKILILTEEVADWLGEELIQWQLKGQYPLTVEVPGIGGRLTGRRSLVSIIREAVGIRV
ncbi:MAG: ATPase V [Treponema sp.]|nr:ATPase V [Treponema sp.]